MNKSDLTEIIRKIVAEEVRDQLPVLITEMFGSKKQSISNHPTKKIVESVRPAIKILIPKTGNPALDAVLAQTTPGFSGGSGYDTGASMDGQFGMIGEGIDYPQTEYSDQIPSSVSLDLPFLKRDFSAILKKSEKASASRGIRPL